MGYVAGKRIEEGEAVRLDQIEGKVWPIRLEASVVAEPVAAEDIAAGYLISLSEDKRSVRLTNIAEYRTDGIAAEFIAKGERASYDGATGYLRKMP